MTPILTLAEEVGDALLQQQQTLALAESCTGGGIAKAITEIAGSSHWFDRGFVTYSNQAKMDMLAVSEKTLENFGAVSKETALEMAQGALRNSQADYAVAVTGIAGPGGGESGKPVGLVWFAWVGPENKMTTISHQFSGNRHQVREETIRVALEGLLNIIK